MSTSHNPDSNSHINAMQDSNSPNSTSTNPQIPSQVPGWSFYYRPFNDFQIYLINYKEITLNELIINTLYPSRDHHYYDLFVFYFQHPNDQKIYQVTCRMFSHSIIVQYLNLNLFGLRQNEQQQQQSLEFSNKHKENLEFHLRQFLTDNLGSNINDIGF
ncbi:883_t:CDS:1 [Funneliformis geosporum]|uniref:17016_t:CDS:1 n=1 Tax=Funneliformis geosporum TaxID=1117311 RepID=A0A9W4SKD2_9GLOM|nr:17016_t:CDS:1 [Funneliformis geosporum]CAI2177257.1 883_t:CDS:1 [Funneliformis geosporum]